MRDLSPTQRRVLAGVFVLVLIATAALIAVAASGHKPKNDNLGLTVGTTTSTSTTATSLDATTSSTTAAPTTTGAVAPTSTTLPPPVDVTCPTTTVSCPGSPFGTGTAKTVTFPDANIDCTLYFDEPADPSPSRCVTVGKTGARVSAVIERGADHKFHVSVWRETATANQFAVVLDTGPGQPFDDVQVDTHGVTGTGVQQLTFGFHVSSFLQVDVVDPQAEGGTRVTLHQELRLGSAVPFAERQPGRAPDGHIDGFNANGNGATFEHLLFQFVGGHWQRTDLGPIPGADVPPTKI